MENPSLKCVSWNLSAPQVRVEDVALKWDARIAIIRYQLIIAKPDLILLQEVNTETMANDFVFLLEDYFHMVHHRCATFWRKSRFNLLKTIEHSAGLTCILKADQCLKLCVTNVHLKGDSKRGEKKRSNQLSSILANIKRYSDVVLGGDFNDILEKDSALESLLEEHKFIGVNEKLLSCYIKVSGYKPFDYILTKGDLLRSEYIVSDTPVKEIPDERNPSNHLMISLSIK